MRTQRAANERIRALLKLDLSFKQQATACWGCWRHLQRSPAKDADAARKDGISPVFQPMLPAPLPPPALVIVQKGVDSLRALHLKSPDPLPPLGFCFVVWL